MESKAISSRNYQKLKEKSFFFILDRLGYRPIYVSPLDESQERTTKALQLPPMLQQLQNMLLAQVQLCWESQDCPERGQRLSAHAKQAPRPLRNMRSGVHNIRNSTIISFTGEFNQISHL